MQESMQLTFLQEGIGDVTCVVVPTIKFKLEFLSDSSGDPFSGARQMHVLALNIYSKIFLIRVLRANAPLRIQTQTYLMDCLTLGTKCMFTSFSFDGHTPAVREPLRCMVKISRGKDIAR